MPLKEHKVTEKTEHKAMQRAMETKGMLLVTAAMMRAQQEQVPLRRHRLTLPLAE